MYGFSATMIDTCGSLGPMDEDLCARWTQLATYMPMVRNYFNDTYRDPATGQRVKTPNSEPWNAKNDKLKLANAALGDRLKLSRYLYSQLYMAHTNGGSLAHPLFFDFPTDDGSFTDSSISQTYMLGDSVKVSPVLGNLNDGDKYQAYFPPGRWVNIYDPSSIIDATKGGINASLTADSASVNIHQKSGTVLPFLYNNQNLRTTRDIETNLPTAIRIVRDPWNKQASGDLMIDDGISPNLFSPDYFNIYQWKVFDKNFTHWNIRVSSANTINFQLQNGDIDYKPAPNMMYQYLDKIEIHDAEDLKNVDFACGINRGFSFINMTVFYNDGTKTLTIKPDANNVTFDQLNIIKFGQTGKDPQYCQGFFYTS
jgi:lysosomal alpha-glucosidase